MQEAIIYGLNRLCAHYGPQNWWQAENRIEDLVSTILIQRTSEHNARLAGQALEGCYSLECLAAMPLAQLQEAIRPAGFYKAKSDTIQGLARAILAEGGLEAYGNRSTGALRQALLSIKGIGPETADVLLLYVFNRPVFVADEYARRLFRRMGWGDYQSYEVMWQETQGLIEGQTLQVCQEWHAVIDEHGKVHRRAGAQLDEAWLEMKGSV